MTVGRSPHGVYQRSSHGVLTGLKVDWWFDASVAGKVTLNGSSEVIEWQGIGPDERVLYGDWPGLINPLVKAVNGNLCPRFYSSVLGQIPYLAETVGANDNFNATPGVGGEVWCALVVDATSNNDDAQPWRVFGTDGGTYLDGFRFLLGVGSLFPYRPRVQWRDYPSFGESQERTTSDYWSTPHNAIVRVRAVGYGGASPATELYINDVLVSTTLAQSGTGQGFYYADIDLDPGDGIQIESFGGYQWDLTVCEIKAFAQPLSSSQAAAQYADMQTKWGF